MIHAKHLRFLPLTLLISLSVCTVQATERTLSPVHWQEGMGTGVVTFDGVLSVSRPGWVWSDCTRPGARLAPTGAIQGEYTLYSSPALFVLSGYTNTLLPAEYLTLRPKVTLMQRPQFRSGESVTESVSEGKLIAVSGRTADGKVIRGYMTFRIRYILACQNRNMALRRQGWRLLSDANAPGSDVVLSDSLIRQLNKLFLQISGYDYPLLPADIPVVTETVLMNCQTTDVTSLSSLSTDITGDGTAGVSLTVLEDVRMRFPKASNTVTQWQAGLVPEIMYP